MSRRAANQDETEYTVATEGEKGLVLVIGSLLKRADQRVQMFFFLAEIRFWSIIHLSNPVRADMILEVIPKRTTTTTIT